MKFIRLLLIEDNADDAELVLREIRRGDYQVHCRRVESGPEMLAAMRDEQWDLIISDFSLPSFNAPAAVRTLKETQLDIPIIIVSGTVGEDTAVAALRAGAHDFLSKNNLSRLIPAIERELREAEGRRERVAAQASLRESEEALAAVFGASPLPIITIDVNGAVNGWNDAARRVFGWKESEAIGQHSSVVGAASQGDWCTQVLQGRTIDGMELEGVRREGGTMRMLLSASPLHGHDGTVKGAVAIISDVTKQRELEEQLLQAQKMEAVGRLAGGIAHDFNNILTAIQGYATLLRDDIPADSEQRRDVDGIIDAATRAASFTRQLLAFSRKQVTQPEQLDANELVSGMLSMLDRLIGTDYALDFDPGETLQPVFADRGQLGQVLMNLVVNARDAMPGGGTISIRTERQADRPARRIWTDGNELPGPYTVFRVRDSGNGIAREVIDLIFEPFFTTKEASKGTGLGLSTVYGIVTQHGGFLSVSSNGNGTEISVYIPEHRGIVPGRAPAPELAARDDGALATIILVEDDYNIRTLLRRAMVRAGFNVYDAADAESALTLVREHPEADVLVTDLMLPGMSGAALIEEVRGVNGAIQTVLISGYSSMDLTLTADVAFVEKPFTPAELIASVRRLLHTGTVT